MDLISNCCGAKPFFELSYIHGVKMNEKEEYIGMCSACKENAIFEEEEE